MRNTDCLKTTCLFAVILAATAASAAKPSAPVPRRTQTCDLTVNLDATDGYFPLPSRFTVVSDTNRSETRPTTVMLPDRKTIFAFWDLYHGGPCGPAAVSEDGGLTWKDISDRIPAAFRDTHDTPFAFRFVDPRTGKARIRVFASYGTATRHDWRGPDDRPLAEAMPSIVSEDDGRTWKMLPPLGADFACVSCFSGAVRLKDGSYLAVFARGPLPNGSGWPWNVMCSVSRDGGLTWEKPRPVTDHKSSLCSEPTVCASPDGNEILCFMGSRFGRFSSQLCITTDGGETWSKPRGVSGALAGARHMVTTMPDGRYVATFRRGRDAWGWLGDYRALRDGHGADGVQVRLFHNYGAPDDCGNTGVHVLEDSTVLVVSHTEYSPFRPLDAIVAMRFTQADIDEDIRNREMALRNFENWKPFENSQYKPLTFCKQHGPFPQALILKYGPGSDHMGDDEIVFHGSAHDIHRVSGGKFIEHESPTGVYSPEKYLKMFRGNAAVMVWPVKVEQDCTAKLRVHAGPAFGCWLGGRCLKPIAPTTIPIPCALDVQLKAGVNDIMVLVARPYWISQHRPPNTEDPLQVAAALSGVDFTYEKPKRVLELKADEPSIDDIPGDELE